MTLLVNRRAKPGQVHALVIGVGSYTDLDVARAKEFGLDARLTSPPRSAAAFAQFVVGTLDSGRPLGTVDLYLSGADRITTDLGTKTGIDDATTPKVVAAIKSWAKRSRRHDDNVALFYFCGHGINRAGQQGLLLADFGKEPNPFESAVELTSLQGAMGNGSPDLQAFFIDTCRQPSPAAMALGGPIGQDVLGWRTDVRGTENSAIFYATLPTDPAYGTTNQVSPFTEALLRALNGLGARRAGGTWEVSTSCLGRGIAAAMQEGSSWSLGQRPNTGGWQADQPPLHTLDDPGDIPLTMKVEPAEHLKAVELVMPGGARKRFKAVPIMKADLPVGQYRRRARFTNANCILNDEDFPLEPPRADLSWSAQWR